MGLIRPLESSSRMAARARLPLSCVVFCFVLFCFVREEGQRKTRGVSGGRRATSEKRPRPKPTNSLSTHAQAIRQDRRGDHLVLGHLGDQLVVRRLVEQHQVVDLLLELALAPLLRVLVNVGGVGVKLFCLVCWFVGLVGWLVLFWWGDEKGYCVSMGEERGGGSLGDRDQRWRDGRERASGRASPASAAPLRLPLQKNNGGGSAGRSQDVRALSAPSSCPCCCSAQPRPWPPCSSLLWAPVVVVLGAGERERERVVAGGRKEGGEG
jgi:hypothetical protein